MNIPELYDTTRIRTYGGRYIDPLNPDPEAIDINDIAHALSNICRFGGHTMRFYSVAEHSLHVMQLVKAPELKLCALLHDASEAYLLDIPSPVKHRLTDYKQAEFKLMTIIARKYRFEWPKPKEVQLADDRALEWEWNNILTNSKHDPLFAKHAKQQFLLAFNSLR